MAGLSLIFARVVAVTTKTVVGAAMAWMPATTAERARPVGEILNVSEAFVEGYPQTFPPTTQVRVVD